MNKADISREVSSIEQSAGLFQAIAHGDSEHREWLRQAIEDHFAGREVAPPRGLGNKEAEITRLHAEISALRCELGGLRSIGTMALWDTGVVTDGERAAVAQKAESDFGGHYFAIEPEDGLEWEPTHWAPFPSPCIASPNPTTKGESK